MILRRAVAEDYAALDRLWIAAWREAYTAQAEPRLLAGLEPHGEDWWLAHDDAPGGAANEGVTDGRQVMVAEDVDGTLLGYSITALPSRDDDETDDVAELVNLNVAVGAQRRGVGRALLDEAVERMRSEGARELTVWTLINNARSLPLYEMAGFVPDGAQRPDPGWLFDDVRLRLVL